MDHKERTMNWWLCDNFVHPLHKEQIGLLHMGEPTVFILIRDYGESCRATYEDFVNDIAEVNFLYPEERSNTNIDELLNDSWNFLAAQEQADEDAMEEYEEP